MGKRKVPVKQEHFSERERIRLLTDVDKALLAIFAISFVLAIIGLQVMSGGYLPIPAGSFIHSLLFSNFNLAWLFYLPSQVLIALSAQNHKERP